MIRFLSVCLLLGLSAVRCEEGEEGDERLGYYSITSAGASTLSFNATSVQNMVILGLLLLVLGALILHPLIQCNLRTEYGHPRPPPTRPRSPDPPPSHSMQPPYRIWSSSASSYSSS